MAGFGAQFEQFIDERMNARLTAFKGELQQQYSDELDKVKKELLATKKELQKTKTSYTKLNATVSDYTSKVTNKENSFANVQAAIDRLDVAVNGNGKDSLAKIAYKVSGLRRAWRAHESTIKSMASAHYDIQQQLGTCQNGVDRQQSITDGLKDVLNGAPISTSHTPTAPPSSHDGATRASAVPVTVPDANMHLSSVPIERPPTRPSSSRPQSAPIGSVVDRSQVPQQPNGVRQHLLTSSFTFRETSVVTAQTHQATSPAADAMDEDEDEKNGDEDQDQDQDQGHSSSETVGTKRRANQAPTSDNESQATPVALKRRCGDSNLRRASSDPVRQQTTPTTSMARDGQLRSLSSGIELPSWFDCTNESQTPASNNANPLRGWGPRTVRFDEQVSPAEERPPSKVADPTTAVGSQPQQSIRGVNAVPAPAGSQRRSGRAPRPTEPYPGQTLYPRQVPDYGRRGGNSMD